MANRYTNLVGSRKISEDFNNINIGFDRVQAEMDTKGTPADAQAKADAAEAAAIAAASADLAAHKARGADEHPTAKGNAAGFMSAADKLKSDASTSAATPDTLMQRDAVGRAKVTAPVEADDIARKAETDAVQSNLESHAADTDIHVTADDHVKLNGIAEGAEVNQNAFAKVNDVEASTKSDTVTFVGGTGIAVTTNPSTKQVTVTATGTATPGAHASSHVTGGSDVIPDAVTDGASGLMSGADAKFVRVEGETKAGAQAKADEVKDYIESRLDNPERASITLQPGIHVVQADQDAAFKLEGLQGRTVLNYQSQIGIFGVLNPYVIRYGANLLPPFYEWTTTVIGAGKTNVTEPYELYQYSKDSDNYVTSFVQIPVIPGGTYTLSAEISKTPNTIVDSLFFYWIGTDGNRLPGEGAATRKFRGTYVVPNNAVQMQMYVVMDVNNDSTAYKTQIIKNPMLNIGSTALPFVAREDSMLALQTELHANPDTGANPDMVFERDGQYFKLAKWRKVVLDGSFAFAPFGSGTGLKVVNAMLPGPPAVDGSGVLTKYQGKVIKETDYATVNSAADNLNIGSSGANGVFDNFQISIANVDSGWGDSYTNLTAEEIKAYFMGWRMYDGSSGGTPYNGTGTKYWHKLSDGTSTPGAGTTSLPTTQAPNWTPYQLLYQLATPIVEPITSEGQLTLVEGANQVEVGTGIVLRESAKPQISDYGTYINSAFPGFEQTKLKYRTSKILTLFKNGKFDPSWVRNTLDAYGLERAVLSSYDPSAAYSVTYLMLDKYPTTNFDGTYAENEKALLLDTVRTLQENTTRISVLESKKAEKDAPSWITPTLVNGWVDFSASYQPAGYYKDSQGLIHLRGLISGGANNMGAGLFRLPIGYRPKKAIVFNILTSNSTALVAATIEISSDGVVYLGFTGGNTWLNLETISFLAEQ